MVPENISEMIEKQREFFHSSRTKDIGFRMEMLKKLRNVIDGYERRITQALYDDLGKSPSPGGPQ